jgi:hypothetical protein
LRTEVKPALIFGSPEVEGLRIPPRPPFILPLSLNDLRAVERLAGVAGTPDLIPCGGSRWIEWTKLGKTHPDRQAAWDLPRILERLYPDQKKRARERDPSSPLSNNRPCDRLKSGEDCFGLDPARHVVDVNMGKTNDTSQRKGSRTDLSEHFWVVRWQHLNLV